MPLNRREFLRMFGIGVATVAVSELDRVFPWLKKPFSKEAATNSEHIGDAQLPSAIGRVDFFPSLAEQVALDSVQKESIDQKITAQLQTIFDQVKNQPNRAEQLTNELKKHQDLANFLMLRILKERQTHGRFTTDITEMTVRCLTAKEANPTTEASPWMELTSLLNSQTAALEYYEDEKTRGLELSVALDYSQITQFCSRHPEVKVLNASFEFGRYTLRVEFERRQTQEQLKNKLFVAGGDDGESTWYVRRNLDGTAPQYGLQTQDGKLVPIDENGNIVPIFTEDQVNKEAEDAFQKNPFTPLSSPSPIMVEPYASDRKALEDFAKSTPDVLISTAGGNLDSFSLLESSPNNAIISVPLNQGESYGVRWTEVNGFADVYVLPEDLQELAQSTFATQGAHSPLLDSSSATTAFITGLMWKLRSEHSEWGAGLAKSYFLRKYTLQKDLTVHIGAYKTEYAQGEKQLSLPVLNSTLIRQDFLQSEIPIDQDLVSELQPKTKTDFLRRLFGGRN